MSRGARILAGTFLSGTAAAAGGRSDRSVFLGTIYIAVYLAFVQLAPILALAAAFLGLWQSWLRREGDPSVGQPVTKDE